MADDDKKEHEEITKLENGLENTDLNETDPSNTEETETREITQTDHLNKKLLSAFLDRINQNQNLINTNTEESEQSQVENTDGSEDDPVIEK